MYVFYTYFLYSQPTRVPCRQIRIILTISCPRIMLRRTNESTLDDWARCPRCCVGIDRVARDHPRAYEQCKTPPNQSFNPANRNPDPRTLTLISDRHGGVGLGSNSTVRLVIFTSRIERIRGRSNLPNIRNAGDCSYCHSSYPTNCSVYARCGPLHCQAPACDHNPAPRDFDRVRKHLGPDEAGAAHRGTLFDDEGLLRRSDAMRDDMRRQYRMPGLFVPNEVQHIWYGVPRATRMPTIERKRQSRGRSALARLKRKRHRRKQSKHAAKARTHVAAQLSIGTVKNSGVANAMAVQYFEFPRLETNVDNAAGIRHSIRRSELGAGDALLFYSNTYADPCLAACQ